MNDKKGAIEHLKEHQKYPTTKDELTAACYDLSDFSEVDKKWFDAHLSDKIYKSADEVIKAVGLNK